MPKASKAVAASRSRSSKLNLAMAVAEISDDRVLLANPGNEAELVINPVASVESVAHDVFSKLWSAIRQFEIVRKNVPVFWFDAINKRRRNKRH